MSGANFFLMQEPVADDFGWIWAVLLKSQVNVIRHPSTCRTIVQALRKRRHGCEVNSEPKRGVDPSTCGWKFIATVSTLTEKGEEGGQYAVGTNY